jgi:hypothetical protein
MDKMQSFFRKLDELDHPLAWSEVSKTTPRLPQEEPGRARSVLAAVVALAIGAFVIAVAWQAIPSSKPSSGKGAGSQTVGAGSGPIGTSPSPGWLSHSDEAGVTIDTPADWTFNGDPVPALRSPALLFMTGTGPIPTGGDCAPSAAIAQLPANGGLFAIEEYASVEQPYEFQARPDHFVLGSLVGPLECWDAQAYVILFQDGGRFFQVFAILGSEAPASLTQLVEQSLDSLVVTPSGNDDTLAKSCSQGLWTSCPEAAWVYQVLTHAGVEHLGSLGDSAILGLAGNQSFAIWTSQQDMNLGSDCQLIAASRVCTLGSRLVWRAQGVLVWLEPALSPQQSLKTTPGFPGTSDLKQLVSATELLSLRP